MARPASEGKTCASSERTSSSRPAKERQIEPAQILVERVDEDREGEIELEVRCRARQDEPPAGIRPRCELRKQARLADAGLADHVDCGRAPLIDLRECLVERAQLPVSPDEVVGKHCLFSLPGEDKSGWTDLEIRVRDQGDRLMS